MKFIGGLSTVRPPSDKRTSRDLARFVTLCWGGGLRTVCRQSINYPANPPQNACFCWRFAGLSGFAVICRPEPCGAVRRRSFRGICHGFATASTKQLEEFWIAYVFQGCKFTRRSRSGITNVKMNWVTASHLARIPDSPSRVNLRILPTWGK